MRHKIRVSQFCALSHDIAFQNWLAVSFSDLHKILINHLMNSSSCYDNKQKMLELLREITKRGKEQDLINFLMAEFPLLIDEVDPKVIRKPRINNRPQKHIGPFRYYNPILLSFPQKHIIRSIDREQLIKAVNDFIIDKIGVDYLVIDDTAYIEYFKMKYQSEYSVVPAVTREIYQYREALNISQGLKILEW
jgi:hypothetical protein